MTPTTLEGWMELMSRNQAGITEMYSKIMRMPSILIDEASPAMKFYQKKVELHEWIEQRIINKYGESC